MRPPYTVFDRPYRLDRGRAALTASGPPPPSPLDHEAVVGALRRAKEQREPDPRALQGLTLLVCSVLCCAAICASYVMPLRAPKEKKPAKLGPVALCAALLARRPLLERWVCMGCPPDFAEAAAGL